ncbi:MAG: MFS transporter, partial [Beijerinckiaceae bacterium]
FAAPLMGWVADSGVALRIIALVANLAAGAVVFAMLGVSGLMPMAALMATMYALHGPLSSMIDAAVSREVLRLPALDYARIRLWGSVAFIAGTFAGGAIADRLNGDWIAALIAAAMIVSAALALLLPVQKPVSAGSAAAEREAAPMRWRMAMIALLILGSAGIQSSHAGVFTVSAMAWGAQGLPQTATAVLWTLGVVPEILLFMRAGRLLSDVPRALAFMALGGVLAVLRWIIMAQEPGLALTAFCQVLHGLTFGATHLGLIAVLAVLSPPRFRSRIQGINAAVHALTNSLGIYLAGTLFHSGGAPATYMAMAVFAGVGLALVAVLFGVQRQALRTP